MDELWLLALVLAAIGFYLWLAFLFFSVVALPIGIVLVVLFSGWFGGVYVNSVWTVMFKPGSQSKAKVVNHPIHDPSPDGEPAFQQYFYGQAIEDLKTSTGMAASRCGSIAQDLVDKISAWGFGDLVWVTWPVGVVAFGALGASVLGASLAVLAIAVVHTVVVLLLQACTHSVAMFLRFVDRMLRRRSGARITCPGCYQAVDFPSYECPSDSCTRRHGDVRPGRYGVRHRTCACGEKLPTLFMFGSHKLKAFCPQCGDPLADEVGTVPEVILPVLGASGAGKTRLMAASVLALERHNGVEVNFADRESSREFDRIRRVLLAGQDTQKTNAKLPRAYSLYLANQSGKRLLHIFDAAGEQYNSTDKMQELTYLQGADSFLFVINPLSIPGYWRSLNSEERANLASERSADGPAKVYETSLDNITRMGVKTETCRLAVALTKSDLLANNRIQLGSDATSEHIEEWLINDLGQGNLVRSMSTNFGSLHFFITAAAPAAHKTDQSVGRMLGWTLPGQDLQLEQFA